MWKIGCARWVIRPMYTVMRRHHVIIKCGAVSCPPADALTTKSRHVFRVNISLFSTRDVAAWIAWLAFMWRRRWERGWRRQRWWLPLIMMVIVVCKCFYFTRQNFHKFWLRKFDVTLLVSVLTIFDEKAGEGTSVLVVDNWQCSQNCCFGRWWRALYYASDARRPQLLAVVDRKRRTLQLWLRIVFGPRQSQGQ